MKDSFFNYLEKKRIQTYKFITRIAYLHLTKKKVHGLPRLTFHEKQKIRKYWKKEFGKSIPINEYRWYKSKFGCVDERIIPDVIWHSEIEPFFCNVILEKAFQDKNYFDTIIDQQNSPKVVFHCINNQLLDSNYNVIKTEKLVDLLKKNDKEFIVKPTMHSGGGRDITFIQSAKCDEQIILKMIDDYSGNFIVQEIINQCSFLRSFNSNCINTMRILSFLYHGKVHILSSFLRIGGKNSRLDNVSSGGAFIPINSEGVLLQNAYIEDPNSNDLILINKISTEVEFANKKIPNWNDVISAIEKYHFKLPHFKLINWDVSIDDSGKPIIIEYNLLDSSVSFHQISVGPIFGDMTTDVLNDVKERRPLL